MILQNVCDLFDSYYIADKREELNNNYIASSTEIHTDGTFKKDIDSDGFIHISDLSDDASYLIFTDQNNNLFISIYKYIFDGKFKEIINILNKIRTNSGKKRKNDNECKPSFDPLKNLIDINTFTCTECDSSLVWKKPNNIADVIMATCKNCGTEYTFIPSKYYVMKSKKQVYKPDHNFRNVLKSKGEQNNGKN